MRQSTNTFKELIEEVDEEHLERDERESQMALHVEEKRQHVGGGKKLELSARKVATRHSTSTFTISELSEATDFNIEELKNKPPYGKDIGAQKERSQVQQGGFYGSAVSLSGSGEGTKEVNPSRRLSSSSARQSQGKKVGPVAESSAPGLRRSSTASSSSSTSSSTSSSASFRASKSSSRKPGSTSPRFKDVVSAEDEAEASAKRAAYKAQCEADVLAFQQAMDLEDMDPNEDVSYFTASSRIKSIRRSASLEEVTSRKQSGEL